MSALTVNTVTHSVTYVTDNILKSLKDIIVLSGLDPGKFIGQRDVLLAGIKTWIGTQHLTCVSLEIFHPKTDEFLYRWDIDLVYTWSSGDDGSVWTDTAQLRYAIQKKGLAVGDAAYRVIVNNKSGAETVEGWQGANYRSTEGMVRQSLGTNIEHNGLGANAAYWRKPA